MTYFIGLPIIIVAAWLIVRRAQRNSLAWRIDNLDAFMLKIEKKASPSRGDWSEWREAKRLKEELQLQQRPKDRKPSRRV
jgi:hypothetical protein